MPATALLSDPRAQLKTFNAVNMRVKFDMLAPKLTKPSSDSAALRACSSVTPCSSCDDQRPAASAEPLHNNLIIFDWDDTLIPSTWLSESILEHVRSPAELVRHYQLVEESVYMVLTQAIQVGFVVIVTNSEEGWVDYCCDHFFPRLKPLLSGISVLSARTLYQDQFAHPSFWKQQAFKDVISNYVSSIPPQTYFTITSIGDSMYERDALYKSTDALSSFAFVKSIKFLESPSDVHLRRELGYLSFHLKDLVQSPSELDILLYS